jgi:hypothetical protein
MGLFRLVLRTVLALSRTCFGTIREHTGGKLFPFEARTTAAFFFTQPLCLGQKIEGLFNTLTPEAQHAAAAVRQAVVALTPAPTQGQVAENAPTQRHDHEEQQQQK